jgi:hypothetical protein
VLPEVIDVVGHTDEPADLAEGVKPRPNCMDVLDGRKPEGNMTSTMSPSPRSCAAMRWRPARLAYGHVAIVSDASIVFASNKVG